MDKIEPVKSITPFEVYKVLSSEKLTDGQKAEFIKMNSAAVKMLLMPRFPQVNLKK